MANKDIHLNVILYQKREDDRKLIEYVNNVSVPKATLVKEAIKHFMETEKGNAFKK